MTLLVSIGRPVWPKFQRGKDYTRFVAGPLSLIVVPYDADWTWGEFEKMRQAVKEMSRD